MKQKLSRSRSCGVSEWASETGCCWAETVFVTPLAISRLNVGSLHEKEKSAVQKSFVCINFRNDFAYFVHKMIYSSSKCSQSTCGQSLNKSSWTWFQIVGKFVLWFPRLLGESIYFVTHRIISIAPIPASSMFNRVHYLGT